MTFFLAADALLNLTAALNIGDQIILLQCLEGPCWENFKFSLCSWKVTLKEREVQHTHFGCISTFLSESSASLNDLVYAPLQ